MKCCVTGESIEGVHMEILLKFCLGMLTLFFKTVVIITKHAQFWFEVQFPL